MRRRQWLTALAVGAVAWLTTYGGDPATTAETETGYGAGEYGAGDYGEGST